MDQLERDVVWDVIIVGAGISGINAAYRLQSHIPDINYAILETRHAMGGTWDFFKYPGLRSDSDLSSFGFPWRPWHKDVMIADGQSIRHYLHDSAVEYGIDKHMLFGHRLVAADWSSDEHEWALTVDRSDQSANSSRIIVRASFVIMATGYYDYQTPLHADIPGIDNFQGQLIHPQFWPEDASWEDKKVVIIGSGATTVTLLPVLAEKAAHVTMLQRSPSYFISLPSVDSFTTWAHRLLPSWIAHSLVRLKFLLIPRIFYTFCRAYPDAARWLLTKRVAKMLPKDIPVDPHFTPRYNLWDQRLCICPDEDFFAALRSGKASIATGTIQTVTSDGILYSPTPPSSAAEEQGKNSGGANGSANDTSKDSLATAQTEMLKADIIVTATGLRFLMIGGTAVSVNSTPVDLASKYLWKGLMITDVPNAVAIIGYTNASWTLGSDASARHVARLIKHMRRIGAKSAVARISNNDIQNMHSVDLLNLKSTYVERARHVVPRAGDQSPWMPRDSYWADMWEARFGGWENLVFN